MKTLTARNVATNEEWAKFKSALALRGLSIKEFIIKTIREVGDDNKG